MVNTKKIINLGNNINLTLIKTEKFKSNLISLYVQRLLDKKETTKNALIPSIIASGSEKYPSARAISNKLDDLYGSSMGADAVKRGERQVLSFKIINISEKYLDENIFEEVVEFFNEVINNTLVVDGGFKEEYLNIEKENLRDKIQSIINDKKEYAQDKCIEAMCENEKYSISEFGYEDEIDNITSKDLYEHYRNILKTSPIDIVVEGDFDEDKVVDIISKNLKFEREDIIDIPKEDFIKHVDEVKVVDEKMEITQGKLVMGYRANVDYVDNDKYYALVVGSNVLGGGPHSKLFVNVREKESLCYYIFSSIEKYKSIMLISSGIETKDYDKAVKLIKEQLESLKAGDISDEELENSKLALVNSMKSITDNIGGMSDFAFSQSMAKTNSEVEDIIYSIEKVTKKDIVEAVKDIELDTVYFLRN
ncbi:MULTISPECIES: EF-P 5-aminopentanol modification-associated protein YfmF [unclassified Clostridioides]|uniref:EF-P 5-aminopentanol modification-associated protein YfmF n=1 Tax=unclassified Clostridioides TaxID=2635829 RepID=UPI001D11B714|nr:insulinase family protein [Clostridioides sp. ZZV15-6388]MCC0643081.1 insulinase family protein [Clostridioides sp. ZZV14-6150]MCC0659973.1 insulinase family protein [Clostridioides sp. ZZV14-6154]MCC0663609.1 insulinase family protein [Clostridioides sp. ZZV15-6597]MCC0667162.1 insulinase family protein [Clostridioides sp. ZZV14-6153]MCC0717343.1 insulinase family protein [Clostridioides sp. ZZV14-6105]MCC0721229.1 insulinase family protein [Clostridioides sp. ZZV14-6104]MCC0727554.1 ins